MMGNPTDIKARVFIGDYKNIEIRGSVIKMQTPAGEFSIGVDNSGEVYLATSCGRLYIQPQAANRVFITQEAG